MADPVTGYGPDDHDEKPAVGFAHAPFFDEETEVPPVGFTTAHLVAATETEEND